MTNTTTNADAARTISFVLLWSEGPTRCEDRTSLTLDEMVAELVALQRARRGESGDHWYFKTKVRVLVDLVEVGDWRFDVTRDFDVVTEIEEAITWAEARYRERHGYAAEREVLAKVLTHLGLDADAVDAAGIGAAHAILRNFREGK